MENLNKEGQALLKLIIEAVTKYQKSMQEEPKLEKCCPAEKCDKKEIKKQFENSVQACLSSGISLETLQSKAQESLQSFPSEIVEKVLKKITKTEGKSDSSINGDSLCIFKTAVVNLANYYLHKKK